MLNESSRLLLQQQFMERFSGRTIIVHRGFPEQFLRELLEQAGGSGHFRVDVRIPESAPPTPIEWVVHRFVLPLSLPLPLLIRVDADALYLRHLMHDNTAGHPSEILWMLDAIRERYHARLDRQQGYYAVSMGMAVQDNDINYGFNND
ncbi:hypothetical protein BBC27_11405 [Acidithiobacillus ferrivorans]|uniref:Uncharacterized protein n=1 Tax=Acidithiobacillus ferrivorans TaxID=160808 RepID=A0A1B9BYI5_9PROT|nr:hypothetical protein [Acidithiobacillus ferrivorans]OCB02730.1 hypothetical protein BBC27_11405 [Acidithiobacillus ferrivorans]